jgi:mRNA interferase MazF
MYKDFDCWNYIQKQIQLKSETLLFKEREIWWCHLGSNIGDEEDGKGENATRPVLVVKKLSKNLFIGVPLSSTLVDNPYYHKLEFQGSAQSVIISQIRALDAKRLTSRIGTIYGNDLDIIKEKIKKAVLS